MLWVIDLGDPETTAIIESCRKGDTKAFRTRPKIGPGTPYFEDAPRQLVDALAELDFHANGPAKFDPLDDVLAEARVRDTLTLWHLVSRTDGADRARVTDRNRRARSVRNERLDAELAERDRIHKSLLAGHLPPLSQHSSNFSGSCHV